MIFVKTISTYLLLIIIHIVRSKMKKLIPIIIILLLATTTLTFVAVGQEDFLKFENMTFGIRIQYPANWEKVEDDLPLNVIVVFDPPGESDSVIGIDGIDIVIAPVPPNVTLEQYTEDYINLLGDIFSEFSIVESSPTTLADYPAYRVVYTGRVERNEVLENVQYRDVILNKVMEVWTLKDSKAYLISYYADEKKYDNYLETAQKMIDSFEIDTNSVLEEKREEYVGINIGIEVIIGLTVIIIGVGLFLAIRAIKSKRQTNNTVGEEPVLTDSNGGDSGPISENI